MANILIKQGLEIAVPDFVITTDEARKVDLTSIIQTGTTSSQAISAGTYFYLNNVLVRAKVDIANGATFTLNTNYEEVTAGALNELNDAINTVDTYVKAKNFGTAVSLTDNVGYTCPSDGYFRINITSGTNNYCYQYINSVLVYGTAYVNNSSGAQIWNAIYVKKGMTIRFHGSGATGIFTPITS